MGRVGSILTPSSLSYVISITLKLSINLNYSNDLTRLKINQTNDEKRFDFFATSKENIKIYQKKKLPSRNSNRLTM